MTMSVIKHVVVSGNSTSTIVLDNIPQTYSDLLLKVSVRSGTAQEHVIIGFNGSTANFSGKFLTSTNATASTANYARYLGNNYPSGSPSDSFGNCSVYIANYRTSDYKNVSSQTAGYRNDQSSLIETITAHLWSSVDPITSIEITNEGVSALGNASSATLYGVKAGSDGTTTVS